MTDDQQCVTDRLTFSLVLLGIDRVQPRHLAEWDTSVGWPAATMTAFAVAGLTLLGERREP